MMSFRLFVILAACVFAVGLQACDIGSADPKTLGADKILELIAEGRPVVINNKTIKGKLDFTKLAFQNKKSGVPAVSIPVDIYFRNCVFEDSLVAYDEILDRRITVSTTFDRNVAFIECDFMQALYMPQSDFRGRFDFDISKVRGEADFSGSRFRNGTSFCKANFDGDTYFVSCTFDGRTNFMKVFFRNSVVFQYVKFQDAVMFADSHFYGGVDMSSVLALDMIDFANAKFAESFSLVGSQFMGDLKFASARFSKKISIAENQFLGQLYLNKAQFGNSVSLRGNTFFAGSPLVSEISMLDSCKVEQLQNRVLNLIEKQIF